MSLSLDAIVPVTILTAPQAPQAKGFGIALCLGTNSLPLEERIRTYSDYPSVGADFASNTPENAFAEMYFGQTPAPAALMIGNRFAAAQAGRLRGGAGVSAVFSTYTSITNGGFDVTINGVLIQVHSLDLSAAASMAAIATDIQTKLAAGLAGTTCTWSGTNFVITAPGTGVTSLSSFASTPTGSGAPTDQSATFGFTFASGALRVNGIAAEAMADSWSASAIFNGGWYGMGLSTAASTQDIKDSMAFAEAAKKIFFYTTSDPNAELSSATSDLGFYAQNLTYNRTVSNFSSGNPNASASLNARFFIVDYDQPNSVITGKFKQEPGVPVENLTDTQAQNLKAKNYNYYVDRGGFAMIEEGVVANGRFIDEVIGLDWLGATVQNAAVVPLATSPTKLPLTDAGTGVIVQAIETGAMDKALRNGLIAPGIWKGPALGTVKTGDFLPNGYYVYGAPVSTLSDADRAARLAPPITVICTGAGAIHRAPVMVVFQR